MKLTYSKYNSPNLDFLIQFGEKKNVPLLPTLLFQNPPNSAFNSLLTPSELVLHSKAHYQHCQNPSFPLKCPFIGVLIKGLKVKAKIDFMLG